MLENGTDQANRRGFLQTGAAATALTLASTSSGLAASGDAKRAYVLPRRALGKTGVDVTILNQGTWRSPDSLD